MRKSMTYGVLPSREEFDAAFDAQFDTENVGAFGFNNDPRVGTCELTCSELWVELESARAEWDSETGGEGGMADAAGQWCFDVLGVLGFEWV